MEQNTSEPPLGRWRKKLAFLQKEEAIVADSEQKFKLRERIAEARGKIAELEGEAATSRIRPRFSDHELQLLSEKQTRLYREKKVLEKTGKDTRDVEKEIRRLKDIRRRGPDLTHGGRLGSGRFELLEKLGRGGFGRIWKAWDEKTDRCVALKVLFPHLLDDGSRVERFFRGARWMFELRHRHIVGVLEPHLIDEDDGWHFFVMELVHGPDLQRAVLEGLLAEDDKHRIIRQVGEGLEYAHKHPKAIVHRDVKPSNVLLDDELQAKLTDFDLVRADDTNIPVTETRAMMGTLGFSAPELLRTPREAGPPADVYSLAATAVFVLSGHALPHNMDPGTAISNLGLPPALAKVLTSATKERPKDRYQTAGEFVEAYVEALRVGGPVGVTKPGRAPSSLLEQAGPTFSDEATRLACDALAAGDAQRLPLVQELVWQLTADDQLPVARHLNRGYLKISPQLPVIPDALLSSLVVAQGLSQAAGPCKRYLERSLTKLTTDVLNPGDAEWSCALRLLATGAALCPAILAPRSNAPALLHDLDLAEWPRLEALRDAVVELSHPHYRAFDPNLVKSAQVRVDWNHHLENLEGDAEDWLEQAPNLTTGYPPANSVWRSWVRPGGDLERILRPVVEDHRDRAEEILKQCDPWRGDKDVQKEIQKTAGLLRGGKVIKMETHALRQLRRRVRHAVDFVDAWLDLLGKLPSGNGGERLERARSLCDDLEGQRDSIFAEIDAISKRRPSLPCQAATSCLRRAVDAMYMIFDRDSSFDPTESSPRILLNAAALAVPSLRPADDWEPLNTGEERVRGLLKHISQAEHVSHKDDVSWAEVFQARLDDHDLAGSRILLDFLAMRDEDNLEAIRGYLEELQEKSLHRERRSLKRTLEETRERIEISLSKGLLAEEDRLRLIDDVTRIEEDLPRNERFFAAHHRLREVERGIDRLRDQALAEPRRRARVLKKATPEDRRRVEEVLANEDVWTANEYIQRLKEGESLPVAPSPEKDFADYWPERAAAIERHLDSSSMLGMLRAAGEGGKFAGLSFPRLNANERERARSLLRAWFETDSRETFEEDGATVLLAALGFNDPRVTRSVRRPGRRLRELMPATAEQSWLDVEVTPVAERSIIPVHHYGSHARGCYRLLGVWDQPDEDELLARIGETDSGSPVLVFYFGPLRQDRRRRLWRPCIEHRRTFVVLDDILAGYLAAETGSRLLTFFTCALPFTWLKPFVTTAGFVPPEMFFGRQLEIMAIKDPLGTCFIYGGRQLGKTALLQQVASSFHRPEHGQIVKWIDLKAERLGMDRPIERIWSLLAHKLAEDTELSHSLSLFDSLRDSLKEWLSEDSTRHILFLLDEADDFLESDGEVQFVISAGLKNLMDETDRRFKVVFAGLHNVQRTVKSSNHPLGAYGEPICVGPLTGHGEWQEARELIELPMRMLGCTPRPRDLVARILSQTNYFPNLLQLYGQHLLRHVTRPRGRLPGDRSSPPTEITEQSVSDVYADQDLRNKIRRRIDLTLGLDGRYHVLAYALALDYHSQPLAIRRKGRPVSWFREEALPWWPVGFTGERGTEESLFTILDEMIGLGVFRRLHDGGYTFRNPNVVTLLGTRQEVEDKLETEPKHPIEFSPSRFRQPDPVHGSSGYRRSPLTIGQEARLSEWRHGVSVIAGWELAGLDELGTFLRSTFRDRFFFDLSDSDDTPDFRHRLATLLSSPPETPGTTLALVTSSARWSEEWLAVASEYCLDRKSSEPYVRIAFAADPMQTWRLLSPAAAPISQGIDFISLKPLSEDALDRWIGDLALDHNVEETKELAQATGCWSQALYWHYEDQTRSGNGDRRTFADPAAKLALDSVIFSDKGNELAEALKVLDELAVWNEPLTDNDIVEGLETGDRRLRERTLRWAKLLHLVHHVKDGTWVVDDVFVRALILDARRALTMNFNTSDTL